MRLWIIAWLLALGYGSAAGQTWQHALSDSNPLPTTPGGGGSFTSGERGPSGTLLVGSDLCGVFRSTNEGESWQCPGDRAGILQTHIQAVGWDPRPGTTLALAAADAASGDPTHQIAIFRSTDDGQSWSAAYSSAERVAKSAYITAFAWRADTVLATGTNGASGDSIRMWRSLDAGAAW